MIVDQHFQQRNRLGRLLSLIAQNPSLLGLGVDEDTAGVVGPDQVMEVIGRGSITVVDGAASETDAWEIRGHRPLMISGVVLHSLPAGYRFDLRRRTRVSVPNLEVIEGEIASQLSRARARRPCLTRRDPSRSHAPDPTHASGSRVRRRIPLPDRARPRTTAPPAAAERVHSGSNAGRGGSSGAGGPGIPEAAEEDDAGAAPATAEPPATPRRRASDAIPGGLRPEPTLRILETRVLRGANYWAKEPVIRQVVDLGVLEEFPSNRIPGFVDALVELLPTLEDHACSLGRRGGFITRLRDGTWAGHVAEHIALEFQNLAGTDVRHGKTRGTGEHGRYNVIFEYREEQVGIEAGRKAVGLVNHLVAPDDPAFEFDLMAELESLILMAERLAFGPSTQALIDEAAGRDIPYMRLDRYSPRPARPGRPPAADPRDDDQPDERHRGGHRVRQEADQPPPRLGRPPGAALRGGGDRGRGRRRGPPPGLPVRHQAARRQPRPRRRPRPAGRGRRPRRLAGDACARAAAAT